MKNYALKSFLLSSLLVNSLLSFDYKLQPTKVSSDIHCFFGKAEMMDEHNNGNMSNSCFVRMGSGYLVIDSGPTYQYAQQAYSAMQKVDKLSLLYVIDTHIHDDHWLGNGYYKEIGATIIGPDSFKELSKSEITRMQTRISKEAFAGTKQEFPSSYVSDAKELTIEGKKVYIKSVNDKAHTSNDLYVYIPSKSVVFAGDLVFNERLPSLRDGNINGWIEALKHLKKMKVHYIIGGHGKLVTKASLAYTYEYLLKIKKAALHAIEEGEEIGDFVNALVLPEYKQDPFYDAIHRQNVEQAYRTLEWESE
jgi:glyoxylase-like metal-dependent hydrolase (beta-lactamase superfamily II)